jgi:TonB-linked SusC/RagA family outer membrane protein
MKSILKLSLCILILLLYSNSIIAQKFIVKGQVTNEEKVPLVGVNVTVAGKNASTSTGEKGEFSIQVDTLDKLKFSYIGMDNKTVDIKNRLYLNVVLKSIVGDLDEVIVIGYESVRRSDVTGSISKIKGSDLNKQQSTNIVSAMVGKAAGVYVRNTGNEPGGATSIKIRGLSSVNGTGEPLYVVDGIYSDDISFLNPSDISSIEILKDAASTAIYGSRGANGVVLITTNKPKTGQVNITYSNFFTVKSLARHIQVVSAKEYATLFYEMKANRPDVISSSTEIIGFPQNNPNSWGDGYDFAKESEQPWTLQNHSLKINFGKPESSTAFAVNYVKDNGVFRNQGYRRLNLKLDGMAKLSKAVEFGYSTIFTRSNYDLLWNSQFASETIYGITPVTPIYDANGGYNFSNMFGAPNTFENPLARLSNVTDIDKRDISLSDFYLNFNITPKLKFKASLKYNYQLRDRLTYLPSTTLEGSLTSGQAVVRSDKSNEYTNNYILTYATKKNKHSFTFLGGLELSERVRDFITSGEVTQFNTDIYGPFNLSAGAVTTGYNSSKLKESLVGFLGRINYKLNEKYFVTLTSRYDGSSKFGANNKWAFFPGIALAWEMAKENFLSDSKIISSWKWRLSAGSSGSSNILPYQSQGSIYSLGLSVSTPTYGFGNNGVAAEAPQTFSNPNLKWEVTTEYNLGADIGLWKGRVNLSGEVYIKKISDLLVRDFPLPGVSGFATSTRNGGDMKNTGVEFTLSGEVIRKKNFKMKSNIVFSKYKNEITSWLGGGQFIRENKYSGYVAEGYAYGVFWEVPVLGVFADQNEINNYAIKNSTTGISTLIQPAAKPGDLKYADTNGDGVINIFDRTVVGSPHPDFTLGVGFDFTYKNWSLNIFTNSVYGKSVYNASNIELMNTNEFNTNRYDEPWGEATTVSPRMLNRWTPTNIYTDVPKLGSVNANGLSANVSNVEDGSFIRVENIALSYKFPSKKSSIIKNSSIVASVQNAFLFTKYKGTDPENVQPEPGGWALPQSSSMLAFDNFGYPRPVVYTLGINVTF